MPSSRTPSSWHNLAGPLVVVALLAAACSGPNQASEPTVEQARSSGPGQLHVEGHRGARGLKPENTLPGFETALDIGVTTLELDLHFLADGQVVVWHDKSLGSDKCRFADQVDPNREFPQEGVLIASLTEADLKDYECDLNPDPRRFPNQENGPTQIYGRQYEPITLAAVFDLVDAYVASPAKTEEQRAGAAVVQFNIETKRDPADPAAIGDGFDGIDPGPFELAVLAVVAAADMADRVVIQSFDHRSLWAIRSVDADIRLAALTVNEVPDLAAYAAGGASIWSPNFRAISPELIAEAHAEGLLVIPWTVNDREDMLAVIAQGVDGLITDRPDIAAALP